MHSFTKENSQNVSESTLSIKRFNRTGRNTDSPRSTSSRDRSQSLSKFFVKNLAKTSDQKALNVFELKTPSQRISNLQTPRKFMPNPEIKKRIQAQKITQKQSFRTAQNGQTCYSARPNYIYQGQSTKVMNQKVSTLEIKLEQLKQNNQLLRNQNRKVTQQLKDKQFIIICYQKQISQLKKEKDEILTPKINQYQKQIVQLRQRIFNLEHTIDELKFSGSIYNSPKELNESTIGQTSFQAMQNLQNQLLKAKNQISHLHVSYNFELRKTNKQIQKLREEKQEENTRLNNRYKQLLKKYGQTFKDSYSTPNCRQVYHKSCICKRKKDIVHKEGRLFSLSSDDQDY